MRDARGREGDEIFWHERGGVRGDRAPDVRGGGLQRRGDGAAVRAGGGGDVGGVACGTRVDRASARGSVARGRVMKLQCVPCCPPRAKKALGRAEDAASRATRRANVSRETLEACPRVARSWSARRFASRGTVARSRTHLRTSPRGSSGETRVLEAIRFLLAVESGGRGREVRRGVQVGDGTRARGLRARAASPTGHRSERRSMFACSVPGPNNNGRGSCTR